MDILKLFDHYDKESKFSKINQFIRLFLTGLGLQICKPPIPLKSQFTSEGGRKSLYEKEDILMNFRLAYRKVSYVNWCEVLSTVLANDEIKDEYPERGGTSCRKKTNDTMGFAYCNDSCGQALSDLDSFGNGLMVLNKQCTNGLGNHQGL